MIKEAILIAGGAAVAGVGKAVKKTGEKINEVQKERFNKVVEQKKNVEIDHEQIWVDEQVIKKRKLLEEKVYHQYCFFTMENQMLFRARSGVIKGKRKAEIQNPAQEKIASIEETGTLVDGDREHSEYSIFIGGARIDIARQEYDGTRPYMELGHKKWKLYFDKGGVKKVTDSEDNVLMEMEKKIGQRCLFNLYTDEQEMIVLLYVAARLNA